MPGVHEDLRNLREWLYKRFPRFGKPSMEYHEFPEDIKEILGRIGEELFLETPLKARAFKVSGPLMEDYRLNSLYSVPVGYPSPRKGFASLRMENKTPYIHILIPLHKDAKMRFFHGSYSRGARFFDAGDYEVNTLNSQVI